MKNFKNILMTVSLLVSLQAFAAQALIPYPTQSATLSGMPTDLKLIITNLLTNFKKYGDAINAINALYQTDTKFRGLVEANFQALFNEIGRNYGCIPLEELAKDLKMASIRSLLTMREGNWLKGAIAADYRARLNSNDTQLGQAIREDDFENVKKLVTEGQDFRYAAYLIKNRAFYTEPTSENTVKVIEFFLQKGLDPLCFRDALIDYAGRTSGSYIADSSLDVMKLLIKYGVDINSKNVREDTTPLLAAITRSWGKANTIVTVTYLLENGANPNLKDSKGKTALDWAEKRTQEKVIPVLQQYGAKRGNELP